MPRFLHVLALSLAFFVSGAPSWVAELCEDDCAKECASESGCPDEGCADCAPNCSSCPRGHYVVPSALAISLSVCVSDRIAITCERAPADPPPEGVFHPPRRAG